RSRGDQFAQRNDLVGVEGHANCGSRVGREHLGHPLHELAIAIEMALHLDHQRHAAGHEGAEIRQRHHALGGVLEVDGLQFCRGLCRQCPAALGEAAELVVMMHHRLAVGSELDIAFDGEIPRDRGFRRGRHVLDDAARNIMQAAMSDRPRRQPIWSTHALVLQDISNRPSTSTAASAGSEATPTVVRAWRPLSPNTATIRSEAPFSTFGPSRKSGAELMKPPSRTTRMTLSRSPSAALTCASRLMPQPRAAACPCSMVTPPPSLPLAISLPSASKQTWPDTNSRFPVRTKPT